MVQIAEPELSDRQHSEVTTPNSSPPALQLPDKATHNKGGDS